MTVRHKLKLRPLSVNDPESVRIYEITGKTINDFNGYVDDFRETIAILREKMENTGEKSDPVKADVINGDIEYVERKIHELSLAMKKIADDMSLLVEIEEVKEGDGR